jgi:O-antigen ligase
MRFRQLLGHGIEASWLAAILLVPLTFGPPSWFTVSDVAKVALIRLLAVAIAGLTLADVALVVTSTRIPHAASWRARLSEWLAAYPPRWTVLAAIGLLAVASVSALSSPFRDVALRGFEEGRDGYSLLSFWSVIVVFLAIAFRAHSEAMIDRVLVAIVAATILTSLYGILQAIGVDPWGGGSPSSRALSSFGSPIFFGSFVVLGLPITMYMSVRIIQRNHAWTSVLTSAMMLAIPAVALALTLARGPWVGAAVGTAIFVVAATTLLPSRVRRLYFATLVGSAVITLAFLSVIRLPATGSWALGSTLDRVGSMPGVTVGGISGRLGIWQGALRMSLSRPWFDQPMGRPPVVGSHLFGYGPDSFVYVDPLGDTHKPREVIVLTKSAHNWLIQAWAEIGLLGVAAMGLVLLIPLLTGGRVLIQGLRGMDLQRRLLLSALLAALVGRAIEQMGGVAQVSDTLVHWAILGIVVAIGAQASRPPTQFKRPRFLSTALAVTTMLVAVGVLSSVAWSSAIRPVLADLDANRAQDALNRGEDRLAFDLLLASVERAPSVHEYRAALLRILLSTRGAGLALSDQLQITESMVGLLRGGVAVNTYDVRANASLASELLAQADQTGSSPDEAIEMYKRTVNLLPNGWQPKRALGAALLHVGRPMDALPVLSAALTAAQGTSGEPEVLLLRAQTYLDLGRDDEARADLMGAMEFSGDESLVERIQSKLDLMSP